jgi:hypothetical protein
MVALASAQAIGDSVGIAAAAVLSAIANAAAEDEHQQQLQRSGPSAAVFSRMFFGLILLPPNIHFFFVWLSLLLNT